MIKTFRDMYATNQTSFKNSSEWYEKSYECKVTNLKYDTSTKLLTFNCWGYIKHKDFREPENSWNNIGWLPYTLTDNLGILGSAKFGDNSFKVDKNITLTLGALKNWNTNPALFDVQTLDLVDPNTNPSITITKWDFIPNENIQTFIVPCTSRYKLEVWGAQGSGNYGGKGGYSIGQLNLNSGEILYISVNKFCDIRKGGKDLTNRILVAGCGGGGAGGYGGGLNGGDADSYLVRKFPGYFAGKGATQYGGGTGGYADYSGKDGSLGYGGAGSYTRAGTTPNNGGNGYYGGGGGAEYEYRDDDGGGVSCNSLGGGGGSGYIGGVENGQTIPGNESFTSPTGTTEVGHIGQGYARITMLNSNPLIDGKDIDLGDKNTGFSISYQVGDKENDSLIITEKLNGNVLRTLNNAPKGQDIIINITSDQLYALPLNQQNIITIEVNDGKGGFSYRNYTFRRTNTPPLISSVDRDLGIVTALAEKYTVTDMEGNAITIVEKLDNTVLRTFTVEANNEYATAIDTDTWIKLKNGQHKYIIEATDSNGSKSTRVFSFTKKETKIDFTLAKPFTTDIKASKILVTPSWEIGGATVKVEACNNALDVTPTWEDITKQVLINRHYNFTNTTKTADKWGINIRIYIEKSTDAVNEVSIKGFGGAFE